MNKNKWVCLPWLLFLLIGCGGGGGEEPTATSAGFAYNYAIPAQTNDGWQTGHIEDHGFDSDQLMKMMEGINDGRFRNIDSVSIARDGVLILHAVYPRNLDRFDDWVGNTNITRHVMHSTSKSFTSALIGIAVDQGYIASTDVPFYDLFPYGQYQNPDIRKDSMTLEDALTMRLGLVWDEWSIPYGTPGNDLEELTRNSIDYAKALLDLPMDTDPGSSFTYNTAATIAIGQALENSVGVPMAEFAEMFLFRPLQIENARWGRTPTGLPNGGSALFLEARDMLKLGQLFLDGGVWNGEQIISTEWVEASVRQHVTLDWTWTTGYGYQWWRDRFSHKGNTVESWSTRGYGGQYVFCIPALNLAVAFTGQNYDGNETLAFSLMRDYVLPSID